MRFSTSPSALLHQDWDALCLDAACAFLGWEAEDVARADLAEKGWLFPTVRVG